MGFPSFFLSISLQSTHPRGCDGERGHILHRDLRFNPHTREGVTRRD